MVVSCRGPPPSPGPGGLPFETVVFAAAVDGQGGDRSCVPLAPISGRSFNAGKHEPVESAARASPDNDEPPRIDIDTCPKERPSGQPCPTALLDEDGRGAHSYELIDCDVHPIMKGEMGDLKPFLSQTAQHRLGLDGRRGLTTGGQREAVSIPRNLMYVNPAGVLRRDPHAPDGSAPGAHPAYTAPDRR